LTWSALGALLLLVLMPSSARAGISLVQDVFVQSGTTDDTDISATFGSNVTAGNVLVATISAKNGGTLTSVSGLGVAWTQAVTVQPTGGAGRLWIYYGTNSSGGANAVTIQGSADRWGLEVSEWSGVDNSAALVGTNSNVSVSNGTVVTSGNVTVSTDGALLIGIETDSSGGASSWSFGDDPSSTALQPGTGANYSGATFANHVHQPSYKIGAPGTYGMRWSVSGIYAQSWGAAVAAFKPDSSLVTLQGSGAVTTIGSANPSCALPAGIQANDVGIWHATSKDNNTHTYPGDWTKVTQVNQGTAYTHSWAWKRFAGGETGSLTVTIAGNKNKQCKISLWRGVRNAGNPHGAFTTVQGSSSQVVQVDPPPVAADPANVIVALIGLSGGSAGKLGNGSGVGPVAEGYRHFVGGGTSLTISLNYATTTITTPGSADLGYVGVSGADWIVYQMALVPQCSVVSDPTYVVASARSGQVTVYWSSANPVVILRKAGAPFLDTEAPQSATSYSAGGAIGAATVVYNGSASAAGTTCTGTTCTSTGLTNDTTYYYMVFSKSASACYSSGSAINATPAGTAPQWSYATTAATMAPVALDPWSDKIVAGSNDDKVHGKSAADGTLLFAPFIAGGPIQSRPAVIPAAFRTPTSAVSVAYVTSQDGYLYAVNTASGAQVWQAGVSCPSPCSPLGSMLQGGAAVWLQAFAPLTFTGGVTADVVIVATRNTGTSSDTNNKVYAVNGSTGAIVWTFAPGNMDIVSSTPYLDYSRNTVWVTSRSKSGTQSSLWKLDAATGTLASGTSTWSFGDIDSSPIASADGTLLYVGTNAGDLKAVRVVDRDSQLAGTSVSHTPASGAGAIRGMPWWLSWDAVGAATPDTIIFVRNLTVHSVNFNGTAFSSNWTQTLTWTPSSPVDDAAGNLYFGGSDGKVHRLSVGAGTDLAQVPATAISGTFGEPSINWDRGVIHVGGSDGHIYTFTVGF
jgi:outer membrane protein assembly factor BamB